MCLAMNETDMTTAFMNLLSNGKTDMEQIITSIIKICFEYKLLWELSRGKKSLAVVTENVY